MILTSAMRSIFRFEDLTSRQGKPLLLSGPPGSGKTATIAKLAALQVLADRSVEVFTTDAERAGGLEQLSALLDPLGLRPRVISTPGEARSVMAASTSSLVLIDGPGTNPYSSADLGSLSTLIDRIGAELLLVMEAGRSPADSVEIGECYAALGATRMIVTKLDMTRRLGGLLAAAEAGLAFSGAGIGPTIGDGFRPLTADGLARLLLGRFDRSLIQEGRS
jgi:flagellar biosynthesis protein FlhF